MIYNVSHRTAFEYEQSVLVSHHLLHLSPRPVPRQNVPQASIAIEPAPTVRTEGLDFFGNPVTHVAVQVPHQTLVVNAQFRAEILAPEPLPLARSRPWEEVAETAALARGNEAVEASQYVFDSPYVATGDETYEFGRRCFPPGRPVLDGAMDLTEVIFREFKYQGGVTDVSTPVTEVLATRRGVCQDFAHLQIACLRSLGVPARYISGYLLTHAPEGKEKLVGSDATHAWVSVWCPDLGWVDFDPTNRVIPKDEHITLAWGRDYGDVSPINGFMFGGGSHKIVVGVDVRSVAWS
ncbi:MAG: transglutaminase family protein [Alphaproteobacteria bacterium]|nr:transglutaminase family protein [Alphaproteobacteria bacterium]